MKTNTMPVALPPDEPSQKIAAALVLYYRQLDQSPPLARELVQWLEQLTAALQRHVYGLGMRHCLSRPEFLRYVLTQRGHSLFAFMQLHLAVADFAVWLRQDNEPRALLSEAGGAGKPLG